MSLLVSIITVSFNNALTIKDSIDSILHQTYANIEYIIIDGNSTDGTVEILKSYETVFRDRRINYSWVSEPDSGIYEAMNKGISMAKGSLVGLLNSDDWYNAGTIAEVAKMHNKNSSAIICGQKKMVNANKETLKTVQNKKNIEKYIYKTMPINHPATFVPSALYNTIGLFETKYSLSADYEFILRAFLEKATFLFTDSVLVNMRNTGSTYQLKNIFITAKEDYEIRKKHKIKLAYFYYLKRLGFNYLLLVRNQMRTLMNRFR